MLRIILLCSLLSILSCKNTREDEPIKEELLFEEADVLESADVDLYESDEVEREGWVNFPNNRYQQLDIRYATENNFVKEVMYECGKCYLRTEAAEQLQKVAESLAQINYKLVLYDCYRPKPVQQKLWDKVPNPSYVTPPHKGSMHNRGVAVDLSIMDENGNYLDMGTAYDFFGRAAHTDHTDLPAEVLKNRKLLKDLMVKYGFKGIRTEWWHFSLAEGSFEVADWEWDCD